MTVAKIGHGARLQRATVETSPQTWEDLGELIEPSAPGLSKDAVEATHSRSADRYREFISGLRKGEEVTAMIALEPSAASNGTYAKLNADINSDEVIEYRMLFPGEATAWLFAAVTLSVTPSIPIDDRMTLEVSLQPTGKPTLVTV